MYRNLQTDFLRSLVVIADMDSFTKAGDMLGRSQSAVSLQMKKLEQLVGQPLFNRQGHNFTLTPQAEVLVRYARQMLALNDQAIHELNPQGYHGNLRLGIPSEFTTGVLAKVLGSFSRSYPQVTLEVKCDLSKNLRKAFDDDRYDLVFTLNDPYTTVNKLVGSYHFIRYDDLVWVGSQPFKFEKENPVKLIVAPENCIYRRHAITWLNRLNIPWQIVYTITEISGMEAAIKEGIGVTVLAKSAVSNGLYIQEVDDSFPSLGEIGMELTINKNCTMPAAERLLEYIQQALS